MLVPQGFYYAGGLETLDHWPKVAQLDEGPSHKWTQCHGCRVISCGVGGGCSAVLQQLSVWLQEGVSALPECSGLEGPCGSW